jgi:hypothetical protein
VSELDEENLKEEIKGLSNDIREDLIQEAKKRGYYLKYNEDGSIDVREDKFINGMRILGQGWDIGPPIDFDTEDNKESERIGKQ